MDEQTLTPEDIKLVQTFIKEIPVLLEDIKKLEPVAGNEGKEGIAGKDGFTPEYGVHYRDGNDGAIGEPGKIGATGKAGKDGTQISPALVAEKLNQTKGLLKRHTLEPEPKQEYDYSEIKNAPDFKGFLMQAAVGKQMNARKFQDLLAKYNVRGQGVSNSFIALSDVSPHSYTGQAGKSVVVNGLGTGVTFSAATASPVITPFVISITTTATATSGINVYYANSTAGNITLNLPTAVGNLAVYVVKKTNAPNQVIVDPLGAQTIDGGLTATLIVQYASITFTSDGANWWIS